MPEVTLSFDLDYRVICVKLPCNLRQVTARFNRDCQMIGYILYYGLPIIYMMTMDIVLCDECHVGLSRLSFLWMIIDVVSCDECHAEQSRLSFLWMTINIASCDECYAELSRLSFL